MVNWWSNARTVKRGLEMAAFFGAKTQKDRRSTRTASEMQSNDEDKQDYLAYLNAHEEGVTIAQLHGLTTMEVLSLPPPRDEPERFVSGGPRFAPLLGGTHFEERHLINEKLQQNAARDSKRAVAAGKEDPWANAPYPPHVYIPELGRPRHPSPEIGRGVTTSVPGKTGVGKVVAGPSVPPAVVRSQRELRSRSGQAKGEVKRKGGRSAPKPNNGETRGALSPIREEDEVEEISGANFPVASVEAAPRGTKRAAVSSAAGERTAKQQRKTKAADLGPVDPPNSLAVDPAVVAALGGAKPARKRGAPGEVDEERAAKRPKAEASQPTRRSTRISSREVSASVAPAPRPRRVIAATGAAKPRAATTKPTSTAAPLPPAPSKLSSASTKPKPKPKSDPLKTVLKPSSSKVTKNKGKGKVGVDTTAKPKRKKVKRACDECRRKHISCKHNENAPGYIPPTTVTTTVKKEDDAKSSDDKSDNEST